MKLREVVRSIVERFPIGMVDEHDNVGLICGDYDDECERVTAVYEFDDQTLEELNASGSDLAVTYHTPIFRPVRNFISSESNPNPLLKAARRKIGVFSVHTALDITRDGLNFDLARRLGLDEIEFLSPLNNTLYKVVVFVPGSHEEEVRRAMSTAGGGTIGNYTGCSFAIGGTGTFTPGTGASPFLGSPGQMEKATEVRLEMIVEKSRLTDVIAGMKRVHPYEEVAYDFYPLSNESPNYGFGAIGKLEPAGSLLDFLRLLKRVLGISEVRASHSTRDKIKRVALCAGSGMSFFPDAVRKQADVFITGDVRHHDYREARTGGTVILDATHSATEKFATELIYRKLKETFADKVGVIVSENRQQNPVIL